jgi:hypothetical protein
VSRRSFILLVASLYLTWAETGGPAISISPELRGFGSRLVARSVINQLGGELTCDGQENDLVVTIAVRHEKLALLGLPDAGTQDACLRSSSKQNAE